ncbi:MAG: murein transglycosylase, partial [Symploca sp. SIO1A3]|nr:murein transglycosylase [Symploca sp. SIO1A3]
MFWLRDRFEAFLVHIQGSSQLRLPNGSTVTVGYAGSTNYG